jgi:hypothetical protein
VRFAWTHVTERIYRLKQRAWKLWVPIPGVCFMFWIWLVIVLMYYDGKQWFNIVLTGNTFLCFQSGDVRSNNILVQGDQNVSVHLMITIQKVTSNVQSVPRQSPDIYWHFELCSRRPSSVKHGPHSECIQWWPYQNHKLRGHYLNTLSF